MQIKMDLSSKVDPSLSLPEPSPSKKTKQQSKPAWAEPTLGPGELGGIVIDRTDLQEIDLAKWKDKRKSLQAKFLYNARFGKFSRWFDVVLQNSLGETIVSLHEDKLYDLSYGDWITVHEFVQDNIYTVAKDITVIRRELDYQTFDLDIHWFGPASHVESVGKVGRGIDEKNRILLFMWSAYRDYFGNVRKRERTVSVQPYSALPSLGGSLFDTLGLKPPPPPLTDDSVKAAYRQKAKETHPDLHPDDPGASKKFQEINEAYEILQTEKSREIYATVLGMVTSTYSSKKAGGDCKIRTGLWPEAWYPAISSGTAKVKAAQIGSNLLIKEITSIDEVTHGGHTRICTFQDGVATLLWMC